MSTPDYYEILQISPKADIEIIKVVYKRLARKFHPDSGDAAASDEQMKVLNEAYAVLSDPVKRAAYDRKNGFNQEKQSRKASGPPPRSSSRRRLLLHSDFQTPSTLWIEGEHPDHTSFRQDGFYHIGVHKDSWECYRYPPITTQDFEVQFVAQFLKWGEQSEYGLVFRLTQTPDGMIFYRFALSASGYYSLYVREEDHYEALVEHRLSDEFPVNGVPNKIAMRMQGQHIAITLNGAPLVDVDDVTILKSGYVGFMVSRGTHDPYVEARFRDFHLFGL